MSLKILQQLEETQASNEKNSLQNFYVENELQEVLIAKDLQLDVWSFMGIPIARSIEFDNASIEDKSKFALISAYASSSKYIDVNYVDAWELEYTKMFG